MFEGFEGFEGLGFEGFRVSFGFESFKCFFACFQGF